MDDKKLLWETCVKFHGHECGGLAIGFKAALYAAELLALDFSIDEDVVCVTENDACGVDAIQCILGCTAGKGNLLFKIRGKQAFSFFNRKTGASVRLVLNETGNMERGEKFKYLMEHNGDELFAAMPVPFALPEKAQIFHSIKCARCNEMTAENMIRVQQGDCICHDCYQTYSRFL